MLAELGEQKGFLSSLPKLRRPFERFVAGGLRKQGRKKHYTWDRTEVLQTSNGESFLLRVDTDAFYKTLNEANLVITVSSPDGAEVQEVLPSLATLFKTHSAGDYVELPERLAELKAAVDNFLGPQKPSFYSSG